MDEWIREAEEEDRRREEELNYSNMVRIYVNKTVYVSKFFEW
mgnify:CR=1 FL=1